LRVSCPHRWQHASGRRFSSSGSRSSISETKTLGMMTSRRSEGVTTASLHTDSKAPGERPDGSRVEASMSVRRRGPGIEAWAIGLLR
jgi:hypothetical protein